MNICSLSAIPSAIFFNFMFYFNTSHAGKNLKNKKHGNFQVLIFYIYEAISKMMYTNNKK